MGTISFPDVDESMRSKAGYDTWVLFHPGKNQFYGFVSRTINYGFTDNPVVTCTGGVSVSPFTKEYAIALLHLAQKYDYSKEWVTRDLVVRKIHMTPLDECHAHYKWEFVDVA